MSRGPVRGHRHGGAEVTEGPAPSDLLPDRQTHRSSPGQGARLLVWVPTAPPSSGSGVPLYPVFFSRVWNFLCLLGQGQGGGRQCPEEAPGTCQSRREADCVGGFDPTASQPPPPLGPAAWGPPSPDEQGGWGSEPALLEAPRESLVHSFLSAPLRVLPASPGLPWPVDASSGLCLRLHKASPSPSLCL